MNPQDFIHNYRKQPPTLEEHRAFIGEAATYLSSRETEMPFAAALMALLAANPGMSECWQAEFPAFKKAERVLAKAKANRPGWNDALYARWCILGRTEDAEKLARATRRPDMRGKTAKWMLSRVLPGDRELTLIVGRCFADGNWD